MKNPYIDIQITDIVNFLIALNKKVNVLFNDCKKIIEIMSDCVSIKVPNLVDAEIGDSWGTALRNYKEFFNATNS
jgi:hypothetical protein